MPQAELMSETQKLVNALLERDPLALRAAKQAMLQGLDMTLEEGMNLEQQLFRKLLATEMPWRDPGRSHKSVSRTFRVRSF